VTLVHFVWLEWI